MSCEGDSLRLWQRCRPAAGSWAAGFGQDNLALHEVQEIPQLQHFVEDGADGLFRASTVYFIRAEAQPDIENRSPFTLTCGGNLPAITCFKTERDPRSGVGIKNDERRIKQKDAGR